ncbi:MAG: hypothetical protein JXA21_19755 [Anaerolineae bacterium]|nr:hypothetical protein [Anaerolineae bacterium]
MKLLETAPASGGMPLKRELRPMYGLSFLVAALVAATSLGGLLFQPIFYPTEELRHSFISNDVVNLFIVLPVLLGAMALARRGKLVGLLFWPGALLCVPYNAIAYTVATASPWLSVVYLVQIVSSGYTISRLVAAIDESVVQQRLAGAVPEKFAGGVLAGLSGFFFLRSAVLLVRALTGSLVVARAEVATLIADIVAAPVWIAGGIVLWRKRATGYVVGAGLLFQLSILFAGLLIFFVLQPLMTAAPFPLEDFVVILVMGLICFVPFGLYTYGIIRRS